MQDGSSESNTWRNRPEDDVPCAMCGEAVSPYISECPHCGEPLVPIPADVETVPEPQRRRHGLTTVLASLLFALAGGFAGFLVARITFGPSDVANDSFYDASWCIGAFAGGVGGWCGCEFFGWNRSPLLPGAMVAILFLSFLGLCVLSSLF